MHRTIVITEEQARRIAKYQFLKEAKYGPEDIGGVNCTLNFDEDEYEEWLQEYNLSDCPEVKTQFIKDYCSYSVEYLEAETFHVFDYEDLSYDEVLENFGNSMGMAIINDCMDGREHSFECLEYVEDVEVDLSNPNEVNAAAKKYMRSVDSPTGQFRGFILTDGTVLDAGWDHIACTRIPGIKTREQFVELGNIRFSNTGLEFAVYPTGPQIRMLRMYCEYHQNDTIYVDLINPKIGRGDFTYHGLDYEDLSNDLYNYFSRGVRNNRNYLYEGNELTENPLSAFEQKYGMQLSDNGKKWFNGILNGSPFGISMDDILYKAVFYILGVEPFPIGQQVGNEWDELDGILRVAIQKTGYGEDILERLRNSTGNRNIISDREMEVFKQKLQYYQNIYKELVRCYELFSKLAPAIYKAKNYLKNYKNGIPALELCFLVGCIKEKERAATNVAVSKALSGYQLAIPQKTELNESIDELDLYHGTHADFDHFSEDFYLTGVGEMAYGWGVYLTNSINTAKEYSPGGQIMTVEVPDGKYLNSERIGKAEASKLARAFYRFYLNGKGAEIYKGSEQEFWDYECKYLETVPDGSYMYGTVSTFLGSDKEASEWFHSMGYAGLKFPGHNANTGEKFMNYVIFDANDVKITKKVQTDSIPEVQ